MAENLSKNKLLLDEKKGKKKLYKSWKLYAITLGIIGVGLGIGLGVGLGVNANKVPTEINITDQDIAKAINNASYTAETRINSSTQSIINQVNADFIQTKLTGTIAKTFNIELFKLNKITIGNNNTELSDTDLSVIQTINAKINYNYGSISNQESNLTITVKTSTQQIVDAINKTSTHITAAINDKTAVIINQLDGEFIKTQLSEDIANEFNSELFKFNKVTINGNDLQDSDLTTEQTINAKINYNYDTIINQETNLTIVIIASDQQIVDAINNTSFSIATIMNSSAASVTNQITSEFIQNRLPSEFEQPFNPELFKLNKITINGNDLQDSDLTTITTINTKINYNYNSITSQETNLIITISVNDQEIVNAINNVTTYNLFATIGDTTQSITNQLDGEFIKTQLSEEIANEFNSELFKFNKITVNGNDLQDSDLTTEQTINAKINYSYDSIVNQVTNLTIIVTTSDEQIVNQINSNENYTLTAINGTTAESITKQINTKFMQQQLTGNARKSFNNDLFKFNKVTINGKDLQDSDLISNKLVNVKINYNYSTISNLETNLKINLIPEVLDQDVIQTIRNIKYVIKTTKGSSAKSITNQITSEFIQEELMEAVAAKFDSNKFKLNTVTINGNDLKDSNLATIGIINTKLNFAYNNSTFETNLIIIIE